MEPSPPSSRQRLLRAASLVFARDGLQGATTRTIAQEAGVNEVTLFRQFQSKEGLLGAVLQEAISAQSGALADDEKWSGDLAADLSHYAQLFDAMLELNSALIRTLIGECQRHPSHARELIHEAARPFRQRLLDYLENARQEGRLRADLEAEPAADAFTGMLLAGMLRRTASFPQNYSRSLYVKTCVDLFARGLSVETPRKALARQKRELPTR